MPELSPVAHLCWQVAGLEARRAGAPLIAVEHLLVGLLSLEKLLDPSSGVDVARRELVRADHLVLAALLREIGLDAAILRRELRQRWPRGLRQTDGVMSRDDAARAAFGQADALAQQVGSPAYGPLHLLAVLLEHPPSLLLAALPSAMPSVRSQADAGATVERLRAAILARIGPPPAPPRQDTSQVWVAPSDPATSDQPYPTFELSSPTPRPHQMPKFFPVDRPTDGPSDVPAGSPTPTPQAERRPRPTDGVPARPAGDAQPAARATPLPTRPAVPAVLLRFGRDLTAEAEAGLFGPVVGRHDEMLQVVRVLHRRTKNSPVLIGEAGVGKTAVVEGLARRIVEGAVLPGRRIVALNLSSLLAGTSYRGQFEERIEEVLAAVRARPDIILFLDELHTIVGAGDQDGRMDVANILKPALARGEIACIGATTTDEYLRHIASDPALERRFLPVTVTEPTEAEARKILEGLQAELERHHGVRIEPSALDAAVELTARYLPGRRLPDKAVDALDEACARASVPSLSPPASRYEDALAGPPSGPPAVTRATIGEVVSAWTGIPVGQIGQAEAERLADLETRLAERVIGQPEAIRQVAERVRLARTGMTDPARPAGVFLFVGPSGVGKTALATALAETAVDGQQRLIRLDMSEYGEKHAVARLIGAPPGYQGHGDEGLLTGPLRRSPHAIVLLDEAEKAHPEVFDVFLQLFDAGRLTDSSGRLVDGRQAIFVLTANVGGSAERRSIGFGTTAEGRGGSGSAGGSAERRGSDGASGGGVAVSAQRESLLAELRQHFRPELLNRVDEIVPFQPLGESALMSIAERQVQTLRRRLLEAHELDLVVTPMALALLARLAAAESGGARAVQRTITRTIEQPLSRDLLTGAYLRGEYLLAEVSGERIVLVRDTRTI
ncbi:MAG: ATP-dependent Clp protease ATP-binding subunit [Chloroflexi bacterium]|nr:ATP-dependent Clp protease ATP-binding subunit [Chloroflexota bacterium]